MFAYAIPVCSWLHSIEHGLRVPCREFRPCRLRRWGAPCRKLKNGPECIDANLTYDTPCFFLKQVLGGLGTSPTRRSLRDRRSISRQSLVANIEGSRALKHETLSVHSFDRVVRPGCFTVSMHSILLAVFLSLKPVRSLLCIARTASEFSRITHMLLI